MSYQPEVKWDNIVPTVESADGDFYCSTQYQTQMGGPGRFHVKSLLEFDCSDFDESVNLDEAHAYEKTVFTFSNGIEIKIKLWASNNTPWSHITVKGVGVYNGTEYANVAYILYPMLGRGGGYDFACTARFLKNYGFKGIWLNDYLDWNTPPTLGITPLISLSFLLIFPNEYIPDQATYKKNDLTQITPNTVMSISYDANVSMPYLNDEIMCFQASLVTITNEDTYVGILQSIAGGDNPFGEPAPKDDPNQDLDPSGTGGGGGNYQPAGGEGGGGYTKDSEPVDFPSLPTGGALSSGAIRAFVVNPALMNSLFSELWDLNFFDIVTQFQKLVDNPIDAIVSLHCLPVVPSTSGQSEIILGSFETGINAYVVDNQYLTIDCGSVTLKNFWGSALDYSPYTKIEIYLPFIGIKELNTDDIINLETHIKYNVDVLTGDCLCNIKCGQSVLYKFNGNMKQDVPLSGRSSDAVLKTAETGLIIAGGLSMGSAVGGAVGGAIAQQSAFSGASNVLGSKIHTARTGSISGSVGLLDDFRPFFIVHRPVQSLAKDFRKFKGYPANITALLSTLKGYTEVEFINLQGIPNATEDEMNEIERLLKEGVLL